MIGVNVTRKDKSYLIAIIASILWILLCGKMVFGDARVEPFLATCPIDKVLASYNGQRRMLDGKQQCEYQHIWIHMDPTGDTTLDEKHVFWAPCTVKE